jgi:hypothetical protein
LKKSALISTVEKYALEIEIFTLSRGFRAQISRSGAQKMHFSGQYVGGLENPTFSTESAQKLTVTTGNPDSHRYPCL